MKIPHEVLNIPLTEETTAMVTITIIREPEIPTPNELYTYHVPTARELALISKNLAAGNFTFP